MMVTTLTAIHINQGESNIIHFGDSRVYELTDEAKVLTNDQTFVAREVAAGRMTEEQAKEDSRRSILLQCIGASPAVEPDFIRGFITKNAVYMLCSDGFRHKITNEEIVEKIGPAAAVDEDAMKNGCMFLTELNKYRKETDNITVLVIKTE
jgi:serine/threonine protein phosphatase PrpC